jgi:hypothetical protein
MIGKNRTRLQIVAYLSERGFQDATPKECLRLGNLRGAIHYAEIAKKYESAIFLFSKTQE